MNPTSKNHLIDGGIGSLAATAFIVHDGGVADRLVKSDVKYRFAIDMASPKQASASL
jgi:hypothetical protein